MKELLTEIAKALVNDPDQVNVELEEKENLIVLKLSVAQGDMGKVIGKKGKIAQAIRTVIKAATVSSPKKVVVDII